ncbi:MAG: site-2 protease family protein [Candidatus Kapaibacterium sp.]
MGYTRVDGSDEVTSDGDVAGTPKRRRWTVHAVLFIATFISCTMAGALWSGVRNPYDVANWGTGLTYAVLIMLFISAHEFGHYFAARRHGVDATLPYYIPMPFVSLMPFGTMGAVIRTRSVIPSRTVLFDIGVAGPLAGFVVALATLIIGLLTLPPKEFLYTIHPEYAQFYGGAIPGYGMYFGDTTLYSVLTAVLPYNRQDLPPMNEMYHYPFLCVGWFGLFVTSLNMLPIGQLDGGHVMYGMFGKGQRRIARVAVVLMILIGMGGVLGEVRGFIDIDSPDSVFLFLQAAVRPVVQWIGTHAPWVFGGWTGWLVWAGFSRFFFRLDHPVIVDDAPLDRRRMIIGWMAVAVFLLSFSPNGIYQTGVDSETVPQGTPDAVVHLYNPERP